MQSVKNVFDSNDYREYLASVLSKSGEQRGSRKRLAEKLKCQTSFISQVLSEKVHLSLEHAMAVSEFLKHSPQERHFFMLLVQKEKAGTKDLSHYFKTQMNEIREQRRVVRERIQVKDTLPAEDQMTYYSAWYFAAIHVLVALPEFQNTEAISRHLALSMKTVKKVLDFLVSRGLVVESGGHYRIGATRIHLGPESPMMARHHGNWRSRAMVAIDQASEEDLHFSGVIGISREDALVLREKMLQLIEANEEMIKNSPEQAAYCVLLDLFEI